MSEAVSRSVQASVMVSRLASALESRSVRASELQWALGADYQARSVRSPVVLQDQATKRLGIPYRPAPEEVFRLGALARAFRASLCQTTTRLGLAYRPATEAVFGSGDPVLAVRASHYRSTLRSVPEGVFE